MNPVRQSAQLLPGWTIDVSRNLVQSMKEEEEVRCMKRNNFLYNCFIACMYRAYMYNEWVFFVQLYACGISGKAKRRLDSIGDYKGWDVSVFCYSKTFNI
jgi:hypothetical protein